MKKTTRTRKYFAPQTDDVERKCDHEGCNKAGIYRAPKDKKLKEYYWFCLEHVQEYNAKWNYYADSDDDEELKRARAKMHFNGGKSNSITFTRLCYQTRDRYTGVISRCPQMRK